MQINFFLCIGRQLPTCHPLQIFPESLILPWENILFEDIPLGVGNFGQVVKAIVQKDGMIIQTAVKMLKGK